MFPVKQKTAFCILLGAAVMTMPACGIFNVFNKAPVPPAPAGSEQPGPENKTAAGTEEIPAGGNAAAGDGRDAQIKALEEKVVLLEDKLKTYERQAAGQDKVRYSIEYSDPAQLYQKARNLLLSGDIDNAADLFTAFAEQHPDHALADNALYWLGECHYTKRDYATATRVFKNLVKTYPKAEKVPDALLKAGYAYLSLDDVNRATHFLRRVIKKYPFSPAAEKAQAKLKDYQ